MTDFDAFDDLNEDLDALLGAESSSLTAPSAAALASGETGVQFEALVLFAAPLFEMYGLDLADAFAMKAHPTAATLEVQTVLETARTLWAFFSLSPSERVSRRSKLADRLVGPNPTDEDWIDIEGLLDTIEPYWSAMLPEEINAAQDGDHPTLDFDGLMDHPAFKLGPEASHAGYGSTGLSEIEARALFAQPLLDDPATLTDSEAFESAMDRVSAYWQIATRPKDEQEAAIQATAASLATNGEAVRIAEEARVMIARYQTLFSGE